MVHQGLGQLFQDFFVASEGFPYDEEMQIVTGNGRRVWVRTIGVPERDDSGGIIPFQCGIQDITERKEAGERLRHMSLHDQLPGLYNRVYLENVKLRMGKARTVIWNGPTP